MKKLWRSAAHTVSLVNNSVHLRVKRTDVMLSVLTAIKKKKTFQESWPNNFCLPLNEPPPPSRNAEQFVVFVVWAHWCYQLSGASDTKKGRNRQWEASEPNFFFSTWSVTQRGYTLSLLSHFLQNLFLSYFLLCELGYNGFWQMHLCCGFYPSLF